MLEVGEKVSHPTMPEWGIGKILEVITGGKVKIFFINAGEKTISLKHAALLKVEGKDAAHPILDNPTFSERAKKGKLYVGLPAARDYFLSLFSPLGFEDEDYLDEERNYKVAAHKFLLDLLGKEEFFALLRAEEFDEIIKRALQISNKTNLIFPNEKMALKDGLKSQNNKKLFAGRLFDLLYADGEYKKRFEAFAACLEHINAGKWTTMTYFPFLAFPEDHMFLKPEVTKHATDLTKWELNYKPVLNWRTYSCLLDFSKYLKQELINMGLPPRDMIDVQSFMWCIAPNKYGLEKEGEANFTKEQYLKALRGVEREGHFANTKYNEILAAQYDAEDHILLQRPYLLRQQAMSITMLPTSITEPWPSILPTC